jgi:diguanylate cyclase (GGDEF)-like protein
VYQKAYDTGAYREEVAFHAPGNSGIQWIRRKIARSGDELAVTLRDISQAKLQEGELIRLASTDELTGLANRSSFISLLEEAIDEAAATNREIALLFIDLDRFKAVNDSFGHSSGDIVLRQAADRLRAALRPTDHVARLGGDEFTAILRQHGGDADVLRVADRILHALTQPYRVADTDMDIGASIGICVYPRDGDTAEQLLRHADIAMYAAKTGGRGGYCFYRQELYEELRKRMDIERELAEAIQDDQFELYYQPRIEAATGRLVSMEALLRWRHPERGIVPPLEFIPIAEGNGQIVKIGALVIRKACEQLAAWQAAGHAVVPVSVNVSAVQFQHSDIGDILATALRMSGVASDMVELEITESAMLGEHAAIVSRLSAMRRLGVKLAVDDFGTGYSSLAQLQRLDMDVLKVDRSFTAGIEDSHEGRILYRAIVSMAHALGMHVVAEGVETWAQARLLRDIGCDELQGYLISKPVPAEEATTFLRRGFRFPALFTSSQSQLLPARESNVIAL